MTRHALLIGVETYDAGAGLKNLRCPGNDIRLLEGIFSDPSFGGDPERTETHIDISHKEAERVLFRFLRRLGRDDVAVVHYSGHGLQDDAGDLHLCFTDTVRDELEITALSVEGVRRMLDRARARKVLVTLDCCYSGAAGKQLTRDDLSSQLHKVEETFGEGAGVYVLSASGSTETAKEDKELGTGVFTHHLVEGIRTGKADRDGDGLITVSEIAEYLGREVPKDSARQTPHLWAEKVSGTFVVAVNRAVAADKEVVRFKEVLHSMIDARAISLNFAAEIETWLGRAETIIENPGERWELMGRIADGKMTAGDFQEQWRKITARRADASDARVEPSSAPQPAPRRKSKTTGGLTRVRRSLLGRVWSGGESATPTQPEKAPGRAIDGGTGTEPGDRLGGWLRRQFTAVRFLMLIEFLALANMFAAGENYYTYRWDSGAGTGKYVKDYNMFEIHYGLSVLLCAAMVVLMIWIAVTWRRRRGSLAARIASISVAIVMLVLFAPPDLFDEIVRSVR